MTATQLYTITKVLLALRGWTKVLLSGGSVYSMLDFDMEAILTE
jgi:hypothetical protein